MNRAHPLFSRVGCASGVLLVAAVGLAIALTGGAIFSPGALTAFADNPTPAEPVASHAEIGNDCGQCHAPFAGVTTERCEACHATVAQQRATGTGLHGVLPEAEAGECAQCHSDHRGADFDPSAGALNRFDHAALGFSLARHGVDYNGRPLDCAACHRAADFQFEPATCVECHGQAETAFMAHHLGAFGTDCQACHDGVDAMAAFDHGQTAFALEGAHVPLACTQCHTPLLRPSETPTHCAGCHAEPPVHAAVFAAQDCADCHTAGAWSPARAAGQAAFAHAAAEFQLVNHTVDYAGQTITCANCHPGAPIHDFAALPAACSECHTAAAPAFMAQHQLDFGGDCAGCHDGAGNMTNFDHAQVFALDGMHAALDCQACHQAHTFAGTPRECAACHAEPPIHAGVFGTQCAACHTTSAWAPAQLVQHSFPLDHGEQGEVPCATCHTETYTAYTCYNCHAHQPAEVQEEHAEEGIGTDELMRCAVCHPAGEED